MAGKAIPHINFVEMLRNGSQLSVYFPIRQKNHMQPAPNLNSLNTGKRKFQGSPNLPSTKRIASRSSRAPSGQTVTTPSVRAMTPIDNEDLHCHDVPEFALDDHVQDVRLVHQLPIDFLPIDNAVRCDSEDPLDFPEFPLDDHMQDARLVHHLAIDFLSIDNAVRCDSEEPLDFPESPLDDHMQDVRLVHHLAIEFFSIDNPVRSDSPVRCDSEEPLDFPLSADEPDKNTDRE